MSNGISIPPGGLESFVASGTSEAAKQVAANIAAEQAASLGLGALTQALGPIGLAYSVADLLGFFDGSGMVAEETTPEQDAIQNIDTKARQVVESMGAEGGTEGATEALEDAMAEGMLLGISPTEIVAPVLNQSIPGVTDVPILGDVIEGAMDKTAEYIDKGLDYIGLGDYRGDAVFGEEGVSITFEPKGSSTTQRTGSPPMGTSNIPGGSTATATTGSEVGDIILSGGTGADVVEAEAGVTGIESIHFVLSQTCGDDETYDRATFSCIPKSGTGTKKAEKVICPAEYENAGAEVDSLEECGDKKSTVTTDDLCDNAIYAAANPDICGDTTGTGEITVDDPCLDPEYKAANPIQCGDMGPKLDPCLDPVYAAENPVECGTKTDPCLDPAYAAENPVECGTTTDPCLNPAYAAENPVECGTPPTDPCLNPAYAAENPVECGTPPTDPCLNPAYAAENPVECGTPPTDPCLNPAYAAENPEICGTKTDPCDNPAYAAENPEICGTTTDPCDNPAYAAENPVLCGGTPTDPCLNPAYAAENPEICGTVRIIECPPNSDKPGRAVPTGQTVQSFCYEGAPPPPEDPCLNPAYAAENPIECGTKTDPCLDADYAAANPEKCGVDTDLCDNPVYAYFNPEICGGVQTPSTSLPSSSRGVRVTGPELAQIDYLYDIGGESIFNPNMASRPYAAKSGGIIDTYNEFDELIDLLRG